jgi:hypothetical protein
VCCKKLLWIARNARAIKYSTDTISRLKNETYSSLFSFRHPFTWVLTLHSSLHMVAILSRYKNRYESNWKSLWIEFVTIFLNTFFCLKNHLGNCPENFHEVFDRKSFWSAEMSFDNFHKISSGSWENFELWIQFIWIRTFSLLGTFNNSSDFYLECIEICMVAWKAHQKLFLKFF